MRIRLLAALLALFVFAAFGSVAVARHPSGGGGPVGGPPGTWTKVFGDDFNGTSIDPSRWAALNGATNNGPAGSSSADCSENGGDLVLLTDDAGHYCQVSSAYWDGAGANHYEARVGDYVEARIYMPGTASQCYNWSSFWMSGQNWPAGGEIDVNETLGGQVTINYHSPHLNTNTGRVPGAWCGSWHVYGVYRAAAQDSVYYDGNLVRTVQTQDNGTPESVLFTNGINSSPVTGAPGAMLVDWVRAWRP